MRTDFPCQSFDAIAQCPQPVKFAATARGSTGYGLVPELLKEALGLKMDIIYGYRGNDIELALERNEIHASGGDLIGFLGGRGGGCGTIGGLGEGSARRCPSPIGRSAGSPLCPFTLTEAPARAPS